MKERIISETISLIQQKGYTFTLSDVAKQVAISKRTIYEHFASNDDIVEHIVNRLILEIKEREKRIVEERFDVLRKIERILICIPEEFAGLDTRLLSELQDFHYVQWKTLDSFLKDEWTMGDILQSVVDILLYGISTQRLERG